MSDSDQECSGAKQCKKCGMYVTGNQSARIKLRTGDKNISFQLFLERHITLTTSVNSVVAKRVIFVEGGGVTEVCLKEPGFSNCSRSNRER